MSACPSCGEEMARSDDAFKGHNCMPEETPRDPNGPPWPYETWLLYVLGECVPKVSSSANIKALEEVIATKKKLDEVERVLNVQRDEAALCGLKVMKCAAVPPDEVWVHDGTDHWKAFKMGAPVTLPRSD